MTPSTQIYSWENRLHELAHQALDGHHGAEPVPADQLALQDAHITCEAITRQHSRTFHLASALLPESKRRGARALYAFCRVSDDLVDQPREDARFRLADWRQKSLAISADTSDPVVLAWADTRSRFTIPRIYAEQLIEGVACDLSPIRYGTFAELSTYCYRVASTVGLMAMHIIGLARGVTPQQAIPYAVRLGVALQMTNILRDIGEDVRSGRLYLPLEELHAFGLSEADVMSGNRDVRWQAFMQFQIDRNRGLYRQAMPGIAMLHPDGRFAIAAAAELYQAILDDIEMHNGDVFTRRAQVNTAGKLARLPGIWFRSWYHPAYQRKAGIEITQAQSGLNQE